MVVSVKKSWQAVALVLRENRHSWPNQIEKLNYQTMVCVFFLIQIYAVVWSEIFRKYFNFLRMPELLQHKLRNDDFLLVFHCAINSCRRLRHHFLFFFSSFRSTTVVDTSIHDPSTIMISFWWGQCVCDSNHKKTKIQILIKLNGQKRANIWLIPLRRVKKLISSLFPNWKLTLCILFERECVPFSSFKTFFAMRLLLFSHSLHYAHTLMHAYL